MNLDSLRKDVRVFLTVILLACTASTLMFAQGIITGSITGNVEDPQGAAVTTAKVVAKNISTNQEFATQTNEAGLFALRQLPRGTYTVSVEAKGFQRYEISQAAVEVAKETSLNITLVVGATKETVTVEAAAPLVESSSSQVSATFDSRKVAQLPIGVGFDQLALFLPGVSSAGSVGYGNNNGAQFSANGQRPRSNNFQIDGQGMNDASVTGPAIFLENPDIIAEYQVITNYSAEYGRNMGSQVNVITKSGTNAFHGTAFETWRGSALDSLTNREKAPIYGYCQPGWTMGTNGCSKWPKVTRYVRNIFGFTVGGPVKKDRAWFFASSNWDRIRTSGAPITSGSLVTPTPTGIQELDAAFPNNPGVGYLKTFGPAVTAGNPTFAGTHDINVTAFGTTVPVQVGTVSRNLSSVSNDRQILGRMDVQLTQKDRMFGRYFIEDSISTNLDYGSGPGGFVVDVPSRGQQIGLDWTHQFSDRLINQVRVNYTRLNVGFEKGTTGCDRQTLTKCPISIGFADGQTLGMGLASNMPQGRLNNTYQLQDNANMMIGRHQFKWGGEFDKAISPSNFLPNYNGAYSFADLNAFIANTPSQLSLADGPARVYYREKDVAAYFQDDWRISDKLTLNLGLRWEWDQQAVNILHDLTVAQQTGPNPFWLTTLPLSRTTIPKIPQDLNNFGPNVGFAYAFKNNTVIRGGFRIAYDPAFYNPFLNTATNAPVVNSGTIQTAVPGLPSSGFTGADARAVGLPSLPRGVDPGLRTQSWIDPNFHNPYSEQWTLGVQRQFGGRMAAEVRYLGNHSVGLFQALNANPSLTNLISNGFSSFIPPGMVPCADSTQPGFARGYANCAYTNVINRANTAWSKYNGLQTRFDVRAFHGVTSSLSYTWSHSIDNASEIYSTAGAGQLNIAPNPFNANQPERGNSNYDYRHVVGLQVMYDLPFFAAQKGILGRTLGGWTMSTTYRFSSGQPYTPIQSKRSTLCDPTNAFSSTTDSCRPIVLNPSAPFATVGQITALTGGVPTVMQLNSAGSPTIPSSLSAVHWLVNNNNAALYFGNPFLGVGRNTLNGQTVNNVNLAMLKSLKINERFNFQLRATAFNVLNRQYLGIPGNNIFTQTSFGNFIYNAAGGGASDSLENGLGRRRLEFGGKIIF